MQFVQKHGRWRHLHAPISFLNTVRLDAFEHFLLLLLDALQLYKFFYEFLTVVIVTLKFTDNSFLIVQLRKQLPVTGKILFDNLVEILFF